MPNLNRVLLMGNLTRDPELRYTPNNTAVVSFGLAVNRRWKNQQGEQQDEVLFVDCDAFGRTAEVINQYLKKGRPVYIEGRLRLDQWTDKEGQKRSKIKVVIDNFQFLDGRPEGSEAGGSSSGAAPAARPAARAPTAPAGPAAGSGGGAPPHQPIEEEDIPF
jgi:single-strand DNA-binding protein